MLRFIVNRILWMIPVLWVVASVTFVLMHIAPGSPWDAKAAASHMDPSLEASFDRKYGLDKPVWQQYLLYLEHAVRLDFGTSYVQTGTSVSHVIMQGFPYSAKIGLLAFAISLAIGIPVGILAALKQNTWIDYVSLFLATVGYTIPGFVLAIFMILIFAVRLGWVPVLFSGWRSYILPSVVLGVGSAAFIARLSRASILEIVSQDHVRTARAKGLHYRSIVVRHVVRNALIPIVTITGPALAALITGTIIIERVFDIPGMGYLFIDSITSRDYPVIMGTTLFYAFIIVLGNLVVDILYGVVDPRIKTG